jgi:hypothetical protein
MFFKSRTSIHSDLSGIQTWELLKIRVAPHFGDWAIKGANHFLGIFKVFKRLLVGSSVTRLLVLRVSFPS